jgi:hypothetical protein
MLRIYKIYDFEFKNPTVKNKVIEFSSRPGDLASGDDWYIFGDLTVAETTLMNFNLTNYRYIHSNSVPNWLRG